MKYTSICSIKSLRGKYSRTKLLEMDELLHKAVVVCDADENLAGGVFKDALLSGSVDPHYIPWLFSELKYLISLLAGHIHTTYTVECTCAGIETISDLHKYYTIHPLPFYLILDAVYVYRELVNSDYAIKVATPSKKPLTVAISRALTA